MTAAGTSRTVRCAGCREPIDLYFLNAFPRAVGSTRAAAARLSYVIFDNRTWHEACVPPARLQPRLRGARVRSGSWWPPLRAFACDGCHEEWTQRFFAPRDGDLHVLANEGGEIVTCCERGGRIREIAPPAGRVAELTPLERHPVLAALALLAGVVGLGWLLGLVILQFTGAGR